VFLGGGLVFSKEREPICTSYFSNYSDLVIFFSVRFFYFPVFVSVFKFPGVSDLLPEESKFQHHIKLRSKCSTSLATFGA
jgi:hypothetical protein